MPRSDSAATESVDIAVTPFVTGKPKLAGDEGVWFFITADISMFAVLFTAFMFVRAARDGRPAAVSRYLLISILVGAGFAVSKVCEYTAKIKAGITLLTNDFFMYYYVLTGLNFLHLIIGMGCCKYVGRSRGVTQSTENSSCGSNRADVTGTWSISCGCSCSRCSIFCASHDSLAPASDD